jgi:tetratricopeptide (TPR) repeat protein
MLESVREFALERLEADAALASQARNAHAAYFAGWAGARGSEMAGAARPTALRQLAREVDNLRAAWRCAIGERDVTQLEALLGGLGPLYDAKGWYRALTDLASETLGVLETMPSSPHRDVLMVTLRGNQARALTAMEGYTAEVEAAYERLLASLEGGDVPKVYPVLRSLATLYSVRAESARAAEMGRQILRLAEHDSDPAVKVDGHLMLGTALSFGGRIEDGLPDLEAGIAWSLSHPYEGAPTRLGPDPRVGTLTALSLLLWWQGGLDRSLLRSDEAVGLAQRLGHPSTTGYARFHAALLRLWRGEPGEARERAVGVIEVADEYDLHIWKAAGTVVLGASAVALGIGDEGLRWIEEGLERYRGLRTPPIFWPFLLGIRAVACARAGRTSEGLVAVDEAISVAPRIPDLRLARGDLLLSTGEHAEAERSYEQAWELAHGWGARTPELRAALRLCRSAEAAGSSVTEARLTRLRDVHATFTEGLQTPDLVEARDMLGART